MARNCPTCTAQAAAQANAASLSNAVASTGRGAAQVFTVAVIGGVRIADAFVDTGSAFSMVSTAMYGRFPNAPVIQPFTSSAPDIIGVGGATTKIRGYVDAPIEIDGTAVRHPLLVVEGLAFPLLLGTDILRPHGAMLTLEESAPLRLRTRVCDFYREQRTDLFAEPPSPPLTACAASKAVIEPCTAAFIQVRMPRALRDVNNVAVEPLASILEDKGCAVLLSVLAPTGSICYVAVANPSNRRVEIPANVPVAAVAFVAMAQNFSSTTAAFAPQLSRNKKLCKVLRELHVDALSRLDLVAIDAEVPAELARGVPSYACPVADADCLYALTD